MKQAIDYTMMETFNHRLRRVVETMREMGFGFSWTCRSFDDKLPQYDLARVFNTSGGCGDAAQVGWCFVVAGSEEGMKNLADVCALSNLKTVRPSQQRLVMLVSLPD